MRQTENPHYPGVFVWGDGAGHRFGREFSTEAERIRRMAGARIVRCARTAPPILGGSFSRLPAPG